MDEKKVLFLALALAFCSLSAQAAELKGPLGAPVTEPAPKLNTAVTSQSAPVALPSTTKGGLFTRLFHRNKPTAPGGVEVQQVEAKDIVNAERLPNATAQDRSGKVYVVGNPNVETLNRAVKIYKDNQIAAGKLPRPWYRPNKADMWRNLRTKVVPIGTLVFSAVGAFK